MHLLSPWRRAPSFTAADGLPILLYHKVGDYRSGAAVKAHYVTPALFRAHLSFLAAAGYRTIGVRDILRYLRGERIAVERPIAITFDDGYECVYSRAWPVLREFGFGAIVFVAAGHVGGVNDWEPRLRAPEPMLTADHIAELARAGIEIGSHGMSHRPLTRLASARLREELVASKRILEDMLEREVCALSYPCGDHDGRVRALAAEAGYLAACATERGVNRPGGDFFSLRRLNIRRYNYLPLFRRKLRRAYGLPAPRAE
ncbi:MAG TPA: polysaccharide deacetylase family protein [Armatimonadota bacterium]|nr:polysaccharide deacetylase family protein [Armatimonadota bacterium]